MLILTFRWLGFTKTLLKCLVHVILNLCRIEIINWRMNNSSATIVATGSAGTHY